MDGCTGLEHITVDVSDGQAKDVGTYTVNRVGGIEAKVWLPDGDAAVGADVVIMDSDENQVPLSMPLSIPSRRQELSKHVVTDELGQAQLLPKGKPTRIATIVAKFMDGDNCVTGEVTIPETSEVRIEVRLKPAMKLEGQVLKDGKPLAGAIVRIEEHTSIGGGGSVGYNARTAVSDGEGWYRTTGEVGREYDYRAIIESAPGLNQPLNQWTSAESSTQDVLRFRAISLTTPR